MYNAGRTSAPHLAPDWRWGRSTWQASSSDSCCGCGHGGVRSDGPGYTVAICETANGRLEGRKPVPISWHLSVGSWCAWPCRSVVSARRHAEGLANALPPSPWISDWLRFIQTDLWFHFWAKKLKTTTTLSLSSTLSPFCCSTVISLFCTASAFVMNEDY